MAKKSQTNTRRNNTEAGRSVVNFYNNGTVNIDGRQNRSRTYKTENNGCTINYSHHRMGNPVDNGFNCPGQIAPVVLNDDRSLSTSVKLSGTMKPQKQFIKNALALAGAVILVMVSIGSLFKSN